MQILIFPPTARIVSRQKPTELNKSDMVDVDYKQTSGTNPPFAAHLSQNLPTLPSQSMYQLAPGFQQPPYGVNSLSAPAVGFNHSDSNSGDNILETTYQRSYPYATFPNQRYMHNGASQYSLHTSYVHVPIDYTNNSGMNHGTDSITGYYPTNYETTYPHIFANQPMTVQNHTQSVPDLVLAAQGKKCTQCGRFIIRDIARHMRIHEEVSRFRCLYPRESCPHKTGYFNRQYDFKKHLLHSHFIFDDPMVKRVNSLSDKLGARGCCPCGMVLSAEKYLDQHIMEKDETGSYKCPHLQAHWDNHHSQSGIPLSHSTSY